MNNENRKRLFIGIACQPTSSMLEVMRELGVIAEQPSSGLRMVPVENLHITVKFLGMVPEPEVALISQVMDQIIPRCSPFQLQLEGFGCFSQALWLGVAEQQELQRLAGELDKALSVIGMPRERKPFRPHVTVARLRANARLKISELQARHGRRQWGTLHVEAIHLYESLTLPEGACYRQLHSVLLKQ